MEKMNDFCIVFVSTDTFEAAQHISRIIVSEQLAACCSIIPNITSIYGWNGNLTESHEYQLQIKTMFSKVEVLEARIRELHTYEVPEIISVKIDSGNLEYLNWISDSLCD